MSGRLMSSVIASGKNCRASARPSAPLVANESFEAAVARESEQDAREDRIVLDDEGDAIAAVAHEPRSSAISGCPMYSIAGAGIGFGAGGAEIDATADCS